MRKCGWLMAAVILVILVIQAAVAGAVPSPATEQRALILYDGTSVRHREGSIDAVHVANLLGHFAFSGVQEPVERYQPGGMESYDAVFVLVGGETSPLPAALIRDARTTKRTLIWTGYQLDRLLPPEDAPLRGVRVDGYLRDRTFRGVRYNGTLLGKGTDDLAQLTVTDPGRVAVAAVALAADGRELPYVIRAGNVWAVADVPFAYVDERDRYLAFCDLLHEMLGVPHPADRRALIRLEDITPESPPDLVRRAVDVFAREGIPFQIALVPIYRDGSGSAEVTLGDRPELVKAVQDAVKRGGTIVLHGVTHQYHGVTADDFEFWDGERNRPRGDDSVDLVRNKLAAGLDECFRNDLYPVAWETPHYTASMLDYEQVARVFSSIYERPLTTELQGTQQFFPYPTRDVRGSLVVPENLGYLPAEEPDPAVLVGNARALLVVRDAVASAYLHDFLEAGSFREVIRGIKGLGYRFVSLRDFPCRVSSGGQLVLTHGAMGSLTLHDEYLRQFIVTREGRREGESYSKTRESGERAPSLAAQEGTLLVATGNAELPAGPPGLGSRLFALAAQAWTGGRRQSSLPPALPQALAIALVWNPTHTGESWNDQESFRSMFAAYGIRARLLPREELTRAALSSQEVLVVPAPSAGALSAEEAAVIGRFVRQGGGLVTDGRSALAEALGVVYGDRKTSASSIRDQAAPEAELRWRPLVTIDALRLPPGAVPLATDSGAGTPVMASFPAGSGRVLYLAAVFDPYTPDGTSRYPFLFEHVLHTFRRGTLAQRPMVELYFDPAFRQGVNIERLGPMWRRLGVRVIYAAAWEFDANYTYDYERLLRVCHANGLLVYAWFEFPQVSRLFWARHPEWREVPAAGQTSPSWRYAMNLANPACRAAALEFMRDVLTRWPWDGVNLAELNFDGQADGDAPERFMPMNTDVRSEFRAATGFDPRGLFDKASPHWWRRDPRGWTAWLRFRQALVTRLHREFLAALKPIMGGGREVIVTALDSLEHPRVSVDTGVNSAEIVALLKEFDFTLQVEDPSAAWTDPPRRYERLAERYRQLVPAGHRVMFDINIVTDRAVEGTHLPLSLAAGTELIAAVRAARGGSDRVALYGDSTIRPRDLELVAAGFADRARIASRGLQWTIDSPDPVEVVVPSVLHEFDLEGSPWPYWRPGLVLVPPGHHFLSAHQPSFRLLDLSALGPHVVDVNGALETARIVRGHLRFAYTADGPALALFDRAPRRAWLEDRSDLTIPSGGTQPAVLVLPKGRHQVEVVASTAPALVFDVMSIVSSSLIVAFGTAACLMSAALYMGIRVRRLLRPPGS